MSFQIGSKYEETKARLRKKILDRKITFVQGLSIGYNPNDFACIFCKKHIDEKVSNIILLVDKHEDGSYGLYPSDECCFRRAQIFFYHNETTFSVN